MLRSTIVSVALFDSPPDQRRLLARMERASRKVPRLRQRVVGNPLSLAPPRWETDPNFDLHYHLRWVRAFQQNGIEEVLRLAEPMGMQSFDRARPLWEFVVVEGLEGDKAALILKVHHAVTDGIGGIKLMLEVFDLEADPTEDEGVLPDAPPVHKMSPTERLVDALDHERRRGMGIAKRSLSTVVAGLTSAWFDPVGTGERLSDTVQSAARMLRPATTPHSTLMTGRSLSVRFDTLTLPLGPTKDAARRAGGKLNDAFVGGLALGLRRYHEHHGHDVDRLRMAMPMNVRTEATEQEAGNQFAPTRFDIPLSLTDPVACMEEMRRLVTAQRAEPALDLIEPMAAVINRLPREVATALFATMLKGVDFTSSNVPGAPFPVYLAGAKLDAHFAFGPMAGAAANVTLLSYVDDLNLGINTDPAAVPDHDVFVSALRDGFGEILKAS
jgi:WS/DGAT/MGAT family acyltransferase